MITKQIQKKFIDFFISKGHKKLSASPLATTEDDQSVLFTSAGMQQFRSFYANPQNAPNQKAVTSQPCVRTTDINEVGDSTHLTFFQMLGNFSFGYDNFNGAYFKEDAIQYAWEFLTDKKCLGIDRKRIYVTYFSGCKKRKISKDSESLAILEKMRGKGLKRIKPQGFEDNFWSIGIEGSPGGPTVEFYIDGVEIWNLVFNEYVIKNGKYEKSQYQGVDTGMGLERMAMIIQGVKSVFEIDVFTPIMEKIKNLNPGNDDIKAMRIIADHLRAAIQIADEEVEPSNKDRGYVLRRLIRRAVTYKKIIGIDVNLTNIMEMGSKAKQIISREENNFEKILNRGLKFLDNVLEQNPEEIPGDKVFDLFQTFGFPVEITKELAKKKNIKIDENGFEEELRRHKDKSRQSLVHKFKGGLIENSETAIQYHTATHLLHSALRAILGKHVLQRGSNITAERLRFDFNYPEKLSHAEIKRIENLVNEYISDDYTVTKKTMSVDGAKKSGAIGIFEQKYGDIVSVYTIGDDEQTISKEICNGPHVERTGVLGNFKIIKEESSSAGIRRIKAVLK